MPHHHHHHQGHHGGFQNQWGNHGGFHHQRHHGFGRHHVGFGHHGMNPVAALATGALAGAVVASVVAHPRHRVHPCYDSYGYGIADRQSVPVGMMVVGAPAQQMAAVIAPQPQVLEALGVASVRLPAELIEHHSGVTWFTLEVCPDSGGPPWRVLRRYSQFHDLYNRLGVQVHNFPRKHLTGCEGSKLESRRKALEGWLSRTIQQSSNLVAWRSPLRTFLEAPLPSAIHAYQQQQAIPITAAPAARPMPPPSAPSATMSTPSSLPPLPPPSEDPPVGSSRDEVATAMEVEVPPGVSAGQLLGVTVPGGQQLVVTIPEGLVAGQTLLLWYDPVAQSLQPLR